MGRGRNAERRHKSPSPDQHQADARGRPRHRETHGRKKRQQIYTSSSSSSSSSERDNRGRSPGRFWERYRRSRSPTRHRTTRQHNDEGTIDLINSLVEEVRDLKEKITVNGDLLDPLHAIVPEDLREKIVQGNFIEFHDLLKKSYKG